MAEANGRTEFEVGAGGNSQRLFLCFDFNALVALEESFDCSVQEIALKFAAPVAANYETETEFAHALAQYRPARLGDVRKVFKAGMVVCDPDITEHRAGEIIQAIGMERAAELCMSAFMQAFPDSQAGGTGPASPPAKKK